MPQTFTATSTDGESKFVCESCGHTQQARVRGIGYGYASSSSASGSAAEVDAWDDVQRTLAMQACPKCGRRDLVSVLRFLAWPLPAAAVLVVVFGLTSVLMAVMEGGDIPLAILIGLPAFSLAVCAFAVPLAWLVSWRRVAARVTWLPPTS